MYQEWPFFQSTMDLIEMILAKADMRIAQLYDEQLVHDPAQRALGATIRERFLATVQAVLQVPTALPFKIIHRYILNHCHAHFAEDLPLQAGCMQPIRGALMQCS